MTCTCACTEHDGRIVALCGMHANAARDFARATQKFPCVCEVVAGKVVKWCAFHANAAEQLYGDAAVKYGVLERQARHAIVKLEAIHQMIVAAENELKKELPQW